MRISSLNSKILSGWRLRKSMSPNRKFTRKIRKHKPNPRKKSKKTNWLNFAKRRKNWRMNAWPSTKYTCKKSRRRKTNRRRPKRLRKQLKLQGKRLKLTKKWSKDIKDSLNHSLQLKQKRRRTPRLTVKIKRDLNWKSILRHLKKISP